MADNWQLKAVLSANADSMLRTLKSVNQATRSTRKYLSDVGTSAVKLAGHVGMPIGLIGGAMSAFSVAGLKQAVTNFAQLGDEVHKSAQRISVSTDDYQRFKYIAGQTGVSAEELGGSMGKLNKNIAMAAAGKNKDLAALFKRAGISMRGANGDLRSATDMLPELADLFQRNGNAAVQARIGIAVFGKSWQALAPLLQGGRDGIDQLNERYKRLGISVEENAIVAGEAFGDQMDDMRLVASSYGNTITAKLLPALAPLLEKTIKWAVANREMITTNISKFISDMADSLSKVDWSGVVKGIGDFVSGVRDFINWVGGAKNALIGLIVVMNAQAIAATLALLGSIARLGFALGGLALKALAPVAPLQTLTTGMTAANARAATMVNTMGRLGAAMGVAGAAFAGWEIGKLLNEYVIDPAAQLVTGNKDATLGTALYDAFNNDPMQSNGRPSLVNPQSRGKVEGQVNININGLPPGSRVEQVAGGGNMPLNLSAGYRSAALGMP